MEDSEYQNMLDDNSVLDNLELQNKNIEPANTISADLNRNNQLGNLNGNQFNDAQDINSLGMTYADIPFNHGGFLTERYAEKCLRRNDWLFVSSNSQDGKLREQLVTLVRKIQSTNIEKKEKKSIVDRYKKQE